jgi:hypothetical protein
MTRFGRGAGYDWPDPTLRQWSMPRSTFPRPRALTADSGASLGLLKHQRAC